MRNIIVLFSSAGVLVTAVIVVYITPFTETLDSFDEDKFKGIKSDETIEDVISKIGHPYYAWKSGLTSEGFVNKPVTPANGICLGMEEVMKNGKSGNLALFYSKKRFRGLQFKKYVVRFENGRFKSKIDSLED